jgi:uncharacterized protein (TIGR00730 family)
MSTEASPRKLTRVAVFCGSNSGARPAYGEGARALGRELAARDIGLVFGGGRVGLMGEIARAVVDAGGKVTGVIPEGLLLREVGFKELDDLRVVKTMHERKALMAELSDAFIAMPGGCGTFEELFEVLTWSQLGIHDKPCAVLDVEGYYAPLLELLDRGVAERFLRPEHRAMLLASSDPQHLLDRLAAYQAPVVEKWLDRGQT